MCGICLILRIPINNHHFSFDFFENYNHNSESEVLSLNKHIIQNKLTLSSNLDFQEILKLLWKRGPNKVVAHQIDLYKTNYKEMSQEVKQVDIQIGKAIGVQSILHLRGTESYYSNSPGSYYLYNGEIWDTGNLEPIDEEKGENDSSWMHKRLMECKGSQQKIISLFNQIRGDFAIILIEGDQIFIIKDYFGKRSLLVGMTEHHLIFSSQPFQTFTFKEQPNQNQNQNQDEVEESWKNKYQAEWLSSKSKQMFQIPCNSLITINLRNQEAFWSHQTLYQVDLKEIMKQAQNEESIIATTKKLLIQSMREITKCIIGVQKFELGCIQEKMMGPKIAILFSGGIDSTLIARMLDLTLPKQQEIDLVNLAFREDAPDRQFAKISYEELTNLSPHRKYNLIFADKTLAHLDAVKKQLLQTIYPKTTHMDFNIAAALHLASAGTTSKIVLTGLGADQIFAGYSRYRIAYKRGGYEELENEMLFDMDRLWIRNLGRDDRAISMNGKETRYPFLYLPLWEYLRTIELNKLTEGNGQKMMLRKIAKEFGLEKASTFKKKAIQFGTRLAKLSNVKSFGSNRKAKGTYEYK